uniref:RING-type E3 ubiquitin transferase n=1 Tax=Peronospora matthiolae TaxID=2874970 RepID=A0AAV1THL2_9STRA
MSTLTDRLLRSVDIDEDGDVFVGSGDSNDGSGSGSEYVISIASESSAETSAPSRSSQLQVLLDATSNDVPTTSSSAPAATSQRIVGSAWLLSAPVNLIEDSDDDDVQILTATEAAVALAAAARRAGDGSATSRKRKRSVIETRPEPTECTICCEVCTVVGRHRLVALKCGHLFGKRCIERWIKARHTCPNCSAVVQSTDVCLLFSNHVAVVDNAGLEDMTKKYQEEKQKSKKLEQDMVVVKAQLEKKTNETRWLQTVLDGYQRDAAGMRCTCAVKQNQVAGAALAEVGKCVGSPVSTTAAARVMPSRSTLEEAATCVLSNSRQPVVSTSQTLAEDTLVHAVQKYKPIFDVPLSRARVFSIARACSFLYVGEKLGDDSYGVIKIVAQDPRCRVQVPVHSSAIRDICIHPMTGSAITVAFDGKLAVTSLEQKKAVLEIAFPATQRLGWSCSSSERDPNAIYCGFQNGTVAKYDMRRPIAGEKGIVKSFSLPERQPVHSIKLFESNNEGRPTEGLAAATFRGVSVWKDVADTVTGAGQSIDNSSVGATITCHTLRGHACYSLVSNQLHSNQMVVSSRSTSTMHSVFDFSTIQSGQLAPRTEFAGHNSVAALSRSAIWSERNGSSVVASWSRDIERISLWDVASHREVYGPESTAVSVASAALPVVDIQHAVASGNWSSGLALFGTMTSRRLCVYRSGG